MIILPIAWYVCGAVAFFKRFKGKESFAQESWRVMDEMSRKYGIFGAIGGLLYFAFVFVFTIALGLISLIFAATT